MKIILLIDYFSLSSCNYLKNNFRFIYYNHITILFYARKYSKSSFIDIHSYNSRFYINFDHNDYFNNVNCFQN